MKACVNIIELEAMRFEIHSNSLALEFPLASELHHWIVFATLI